MSPVPWKSRIVGSGEEDPDQLLAHPSNWRSHPKAQRAGAPGPAGSVGFVAQVIVNRRTGHLVDGHLRVEEALSHGQPTIPILYVDLSEDEAGRAGSRARERLRADLAGGGPAG